AVADLEIGLAAKVVLRHRRVKRERTDACVAAEERALGTTQDFDAFHVEHRADDRARPRDVDAVDEDRDTWLDRRVAWGTDTANIDAQERRLDTPGRLEVCRHPRKVRYSDDVGALQRLTRKGGKRDGHARDGPRP